MVYCKVKKANHQMLWINMGSFLKIPLCIHASILMYFTVYRYIYVQGVCPVLPGGTHQG